MCECHNVTTTGFPNSWNICAVFVFCLLKKWLIPNVGRSVFFHEKSLQSTFVKFVWNWGAVGMTCSTRDDVWICFVCVSLSPIFGTSFQPPSPPFSQEKTRCHRRISPVRSLLCIAHLTQGWVWTATEWYMALYNMKAGHAKKCLVGQWLKRWYGIDSSW